MSKTRIKIIVLVAFIIIVAVVIFSNFTACNSPVPGQVLDEAKLAKREANSFPAADEDYFKEMDSAIPLTPDEVKGRNTWIVWTGGNDRLWNDLTLKTFGTLDFLKTISSHPDLPSGLRRSKRWQYLGLVNEPCFEEPTGPDPERFGLWLDKRSADCPADPFENETKYPGVKIGARGQDIGDGKKLPVGSFYGYATGIVGLRLFPNPDFDAAAKKKWDPVRYYTDKTYYEDKKLIRPYRVGMSCAFCHVGPNPVKPPADPENPKWQNLSSNVGAQYFWIDRIFDWKADKSSYIHQMFMTSRPGALDTSLISSDNINNPRTMNAVYGLGPRFWQAKRFGKETLGPGSDKNKQFNDYVPPDSDLAKLFTPPNTVLTPRVLKDGADSVGGLGALNRVYVNIGLFSEEWLLHFRPLTGGKEITPFEIEVARKNSSYWSATEAQTTDMAKFFLKSTDPHRLKDAPGSEAYLSKDANLLKQGKKVFAETCARCHSSKLPETVEGLDPDGCSGKNYLNCWNKYWESTKTEEFKAKMRDIVNKDDFLDNNFLGGEFRVPVTLLQTNACSPLASNAIRGNIWDNFSSETYKDLPSVGKIIVYNPQTGEPKEYDMPGGGRGYTRPASLISLWSTAPFLLNNSVGKFNPDPSVAGRMDSFNDSIQKMLWPEKREKDWVFGDKNEPGMGVIDRTTETCWLRIAPSYLPDNLTGVLGFWEWLEPNIFGGGGIEIGPIPKGTPISLLSNLMVRPAEKDLKSRLEHDRKLLALAKDLKRDLHALGPNPTDEQAAKVFQQRVEAFMELSACPDYVVNRGHYFGTSYLKEEKPLTDQEKLALIEFLKTF